MADIVEFPNSATPMQRAEADHCLSSLEMLAEQWADEVDLSGIAKNIADVSRKLTPRMPDDVREGFIVRQENQIAAMIEQAWIEGAYRGCTGAFDAVRAGYVPKPHSQE